MMELTKVITAGFAEPDKEGNSPACEWINYELDAMGKKAVIEAIAEDVKRRTDLYGFGAVGVVRASVNVNVLVSTDKTATKDQIDLLRIAVQRVKQIAVDQAVYGLAAEALAICDKAGEMLEKREEQ